VNQALSASVVAFPLRNAGPQPWTNDELAELYRVVEILGRAGLSVETDMGMSDEGDPWFVFCRRDTGDVIAHFARIAGSFVASSIAVDETYRGANFRQIVDRMVDSQPLVVPPPSSGTRLLSHPVVILTAFVATALAHSEKLIASDSMRAIAAEWEHHKTVDDAAVKHGKLGWFDHLQALLKAPLSDGKAGHDHANKEGQALTLASLIAIAMTALQPVAEKVVALSHFVADEISGQTHAAATNQAGHSSQAALDLPAVDGSHDEGGARMAVAVKADDSPQSHKMAVADFGVDAQKVVIDQFAHAGAPMVTRVASADDVSHAAPAPAPAFDGQADASAAFIAVQQKMASAATLVTAETFSFHTDASAPMAPITIDEVSSQALQVLHITRNGGGGETTGDGTPPAASDAGGNAGNPAPAGGNGGSQVPDGGGQVAAAGGGGAPAGGGQAGAAPVVTPVAPANPVVAGPVNQELNVANMNGSDVIAAIANFVNTNTHGIAQQIAASTTLQQDLAPLFGSNTSLKIIAFDATGAEALSTPDVFSFAPGVVFVEEKLLSTAQLSNPGGTLTLDVSGGTVTLVGVTTIGHTAV